ncbi:hypothetical protein ACVWYG_003078 [Pedobacter sp. UYEF25]
MYKKDAKKTGRSGELRPEFKPNKLFMKTSMRG